MANTNKTEEVVDQEAREEIERLRLRFEGAHLVPPIWTLLKQMFQSLISWPGWEIFGIGSFVLLGFAILIVIIMFTARGCTNDSIELSQTEFEAHRENYGPACEALGLVFTQHNGHTVVCTGTDRIVTIDTNDIDETEVHLIDHSSE